jgi:UDP-3-O-[3-hydroxymyristoyl] glucosamine N-acyltransferase
MESNKLIYLWQDRYEKWEWEAFELDTDAATEELKRQRIRIGKRVHFGEKVCISHNCYISDDVTIGNNSLIYGYSCIYNNTIIGNNSIIGDRCNIDAGAEIGNDVVIRFNCYIGYKTKIGSKVSIGHSAHLDEHVSIADNIIINPLSHIGNFANIKKTPKTIYIVGSQYPVAYWGEDRVDIGCQSRTIEEWLTDFDGIAEKYGFTSKQKVEYSGYIELINSTHQLEEN